VLGTLRFRVTPETIRVELDGAGVVFEDDAVLALVYDARGEGVAILDWGRKALTLPDRLHEVDLLDHQKRPVCIVPEEEARWLDGDRGLGASPAQTFADPWEHHGEVALVRPWAPGAGSVRTWACSLALTRQAFFAWAAAARWGLLRRWWLRSWAPVEVVLPEVPADPKDHDRLVRHLWETFGRRVRLNGARAKLCEFPRHGWGEWLAVPLPLLAPIFLAGVRFTKGLSPVNRAMATLSIACLALSLGILESVWRREPNVAEAGGWKRWIRSLRRRRVADPAAEPEDYAGVGPFRLGMLEESGLLIVPLFAAGALTAAVTKLFGGPRSLHPEHPTVGFVIAMITAVITGLVFCLWLGYRLASTRLSLGKRGLTLRLKGWYSRPLRIPYTRIRHVAFFVTPAGRRTLRLDLRDGEHLSFGFPPDTSRAANEAAQKLLWDLEGRIASRLGSPGSYRLPGGSLRDGGPSP
jgi:hypothetical protein